MTEGFASVITMLEQQKAAIDKALSALREVDGATAPASAAAVQTSGRKQYKLSAEARGRMAQGQRKRYAHLHTEAEPATQAEPIAKGRKGKKRTAAQRRRMAEAQRLRYANLRGESEAAVAPAPVATKTKPKFTPEGLKKLALAMKRRWAAKRAASAVK